MNQIEINSSSNNSRFDFGKYAICCGYAGATIALFAATYVWLVRGDFAWVTILAALWAAEMTFRYQRSR